MFILKVFTIVVFCAVSIRSEEDKLETCPYLAACLKETEGKVKLEDVKQMNFIKNEKELEKVPTEVSCVIQCAFKKSEVLVEDKIDTKKLAAEEKFMAKIDKKEEFIECVKKLELKKCDDMKEYFKCNLKFRKTD